MARTQIINFKYSQIRNQADSSVLDFFIDGDIVDAPTQELYKAWFGDETSTSFKSMRDALLASDAKRVNIHINSGGGMMADAFAMHDFIKEQIANGKDWHTHGKGMVCSAATYPLLAGGKNMHISANCFFMIHNASGYAAGSVDEIESYAKTIRKFNDCARDLYADCFGKPKETISNWMNAETWWTGSDMANMGIISPECCGPETKAFTNKIPADKWPFNNAAILNTINNSVPPKNKDMKLKRIGNSIAEAIKNQLIEAGVIKDSKIGNISLSDFENSITTSVNAAFEGIEAEMSQEITNGIAEGLKGDAFNNAVSNALTQLLKTEGNAVNAAIATATNGLAKVTDVATKAELTTLQNDLGDKLGTQGIKPKNAKPKPATEPENIEDTPGITWNVNKD